MVERDDYDRVELPHSISTTEDAADCALALVEYFNDGNWAGRQDDTLASMMNAVHGALRAAVEHTPNTHEGRYGARVTFVDGAGEKHTALVMEPEVASLHGEAWDPHLKEMVNPSEKYPLGTVQLVYTPEFNLSDGFNFDRISDLEVATSVTPASGPDDTYCYYSGWDHALDGD